MLPTRPVVFLAFASDRGDGSRYLLNLPEEVRAVREELAAGKAAGVWDLVERMNATVDDGFKVCQSADRRDQIAIFQFGGHAGGYAFRALGGRPVLTASDDGTARVSIIRFSDPLDHAKARRRR